MSAHTPGPWRLAEGFPSVEADGASLLALCNDPGLPMATRTVNARLIAAAPALLAEVEREYGLLANIHNEWLGRNTSEGQTKLCRLRDLIAEARGLDSQVVQDHYSTSVSGQQSPKEVA